MYARTGWSVGTMCPQPRSITYEKVAFGEAAAVRTYPARSEVGSLALARKALVGAAAYAFAAGGGRAPRRDETLVEGCWVNPATGRLEPPAPWDDAYRAARAAGRTRAAPRHAVGERH